MLDNYAQGEIVSPYSKFEALQTGDGHALLFAIDTSGVFHVIKEQSGTSSNGWQFEDLSSAVIAHWYVDVDSAEARTFDVGQSAVNGTINVALAISDGGIDTLFVSLGNNSSNVDWTTSPEWTRIPFDDALEHPTALKIVSVMFVETSNNQEYLVVDIDRPTSTESSKQCIARYHIDLSKTSGSYWVKNDVPVDIEDGSYKSTVGRVSNGRVDGVYTSGFSGKTPQLVYVPVENIYGSGPPEPRRLSLPDSTPTYAIAASRYGSQTSKLFQLTDLFCVGGSTLYRFAADKQSDGSKASPLITNDCLSGTNQLQATMDDGFVTICGKNGNDELYYTSCPASQVDQPGSWSVVVPILSGVEQFSTYINKADGGNTVFASGGGKLFKLTQSTATGAKMWRPQEITLAVPAVEKPLPFNSYTTTIHISNEDDLPAANVELEISADALTPFYINGLYYLVGPKPVLVSTSSLGIATVVEAVVGLNATIITVSIRNGPLSTIINPMQKVFARMTSLDSKSALQEASFPAKTIAGGTLGAIDHMSLVDSSASTDELQKIASGMASLQQAWDDTKPPNLTRLARLDRTCSRVVPTTAFLGFPAERGAFDFIAIAAGDLFRWLKSGVEAVIELVKHAATDAWHFVATIAGKAYRAILDTVEAVVGAVEWMFNAIKTAIEKLIQFVKFLFDWGDIQRTKDVLYSLVKLYMGHQIGQLSAVKNAFDGQIGDAKKSLRQWAGMDDWSSLGDASSKPASGSASSPAKGQTSSSMLFASHFRDNASNITVKSVNSAASMTDVGDAVEALLKALSDEGPALSGIYSDLATVASKLPTMSVSEVLKALATVLAEGILLSAQVVVDALLDTLNAMGSTVMDIMDTKIHIPVISDILDMIGIPNISFLDLFLWIGAVSYDVVYKIAYGESPFPNSNDVKAIISAESWESLTKMFDEANSTETSFSDQNRTKAGGRGKQLRSLPQALRQGIHIAGHATAGFCLFMGDFLVGFEAEALTGDNPFSIPAAVLGGMMSITVLPIALRASCVLVPMCPIDNTAVSTISTATTAAGLISKVLFSGYVQNKLATSDSKFSGLAVEDGRATGAIVSSILLIPHIFATGWHFYELSQIPASKARTAAILGEVANLTAYGSTLSYAVAVNDKDPASRQVPIGIMLACNLATGGLQTAEAFQVDKGSREQASPDYQTVRSTTVKGVRKQLMMKPALRGTGGRLSEMRKPSVDGIRKLGGKLNGFPSSHLSKPLLIRGPEGALPNSKAIVRR
ncbi:hypothetical protein PG999_007703 [Apiospora kogelbergensis]|uniref:Uncharacterized protein n=1 Tax=Apiospora kogelbergensis TaxID=1337665 RepID=A0AAW0QP80_9PEZI